MMKNWLFKVARTVGTIVATKAWRGLDGLQKKSVFWNLLSATALEDHPIIQGVL